MPNHQNDGNIARHRIPLPVTWLERAGKVDETSGIVEVLCPLKS